jgi:hypothetical protein
MSQFRLGALNLVRLRLGMAPKRASSRSLSREDTVANRYLRFAPDRLRGGPVRITLGPETWGPVVMRLAARDRIASLLRTRTIQEGCTFVGPQWAVRLANDWLRELLADQSWRDEPLGMRAVCRIA